MKDLEWAEAYIGALAKGSDAVLSHWADRDDIVHDDPLLAQRSHTRTDVAATFDIYANQDRSNGYGIRTFTADEYFPGERSRHHPQDLGSPRTAPSLLGLPTHGKRITTKGVSVDIFDEDGKIVRELAYWDAVGIAEQLGGALKEAFRLTGRVPLTHRFERAAPRPSPGQRGSLHFVAAHVRAPSAIRMVRQACYITCDANSRCRPVRPALYRLALPSQFSTCTAGGTYQGRLHRVLVHIRAGEALHRRDQVRRNALGHEVPS